MLILRRINTICLLLLFGIESYSQSQTSFVGLEIDRLVVKNGNGYSYQWEWSDYDASQWGLRKRFKKLPFESFGQIDYINHEWWGWDGETIRNETLPNGSQKSTSVNSFIHTSLNLHPQYLYITMKNMTSYYIALDLSSVMINISYPESDLQWSKKHYESTDAFLPVRNNKGTAYHFVIIPPYKSITSGFYKLNYQYNNANFIQPSILNDSRMDISINMSIFRENPIITNKTNLDNFKTEWNGYKEYTPIEVFMPYKGGYFLDNDGSYYIVDDCVSLFDSPDMRIQQQIICKVKKSNKQLATKTNGLGFLEYSDNVHVSVSNSTASDINNSMVRKQDEPTGNLGKSLSQIRQLYPNIKYKGKNLDKDEYESGNKIFTFKDLKLICETHSIFRNGYTEYSKMISKLNTTPYTRKTDETNNGMCKNIMYYYSTSSVILSYWNDDGLLIITYQSYDFWK